MYLNVTASKDTYVHNKILNNAYRTSDSNVGNAGTLDLFKLFGESALPGIEAVTQNEIISVTFPDHDSGESNLDGKYFILYDEEDTKYYVWFSIIGADPATPDPSVENATSVEVSIAADSSKVQIAAVASGVISALEKFSVTDNETGEIEISVDENGVVLNASNANIEDENFDITVTQQGMIPGTFNLDVDSDGVPETSVELSRILLNFDLSSLSNYQTLDVTHSDFKATLKLYDILDGQMAPTNFNVEIFPLANTFTEGIGRDTGAFSDLDICNFVTASYSSTPILWNEVGANAKGTVGGTNIDVFASQSDGEGGFNQLYVTKEFIEGTEEFSFDVTSIVKEMALGNIPEHGFRLSFSELEEQDGKTYFLKRFASRHVLNQYLKPRLTISWNDSFRDNSKNAIFDSSTSLFFQNAIKGTTQFATDYEYEVDGSANSLLLTLSTGSYSQEYSVSRMTANGSQDIAQPGMYSTTFNVNILDGETPRVVSSKKEIIRIEFVDHNEDSNNLLGYYFTIANNEEDPGDESEPSIYDFWFGIEGADAPAEATNNPTQITISAGDDADTIAASAAGIINGVSGITASVYSLGVVHAELDTAGTPETLFDTGTVDDEDFGLSRYQEGNTVTLQEHIISSGSILFNTQWSGNSSADGTGTEIILHTGTLNIKTPTRSAFNATRRNLVFSLLNAKKSYKTSEKAKLRVFSRDLNEELKSSKMSFDIDSIIFDEMYYRIRDVSSGDLIIPFESENNGTRLSTDSGGMYFEIDMSSLFAGRSYTIDLLIVSDGNEIVYECKNTRFKVEV